MPHVHKIVVCSLIFQGILASEKPIYKFSSELVNYNNPKPLTFSDLTDNNLLLLRSLVAEEQAGKFSRNFAYAEKILHGTPKEIRKSFTDNKADLEFVSMIEKKQGLAGALILSIDYISKDSDLPIDPNQSISKYIVNSYFHDVQRGEYISLLSFVLDKANKARQYSRTPEKAALYENSYLSRMRILLQAGANPNSFDEHERQPLLHSIVTVEQARLLREFGADINKKDKAGNTFWQNVRIPFR